MGYGGGELVWRFVLGFGAQVQRPSQVQFPLLVSFLLLEHIVYYLLYFIYLFPSWLLLMLVYWVGCKVGFECRYSSCSLHPLWWLAGVGTQLGAHHCQFKVGIWLDLGA